MIPAKGKVGKKKTDKTETRKWLDSMLGLAFFFWGLIVLTSFTALNMLDIDEVAFLEYFAFNGGVNLL